MRAQSTRVVLFCVQKGNLGEKCKIICICRKKCVPLQAQRFFTMDEAKTE